jgi:pimeloyl-ACP methyl ester carboxylesterase
MLIGFESAEIETAETTIFARRGGSGPPLLLLHGFPQTHLMWRALAPRLARGFGARRGSLLPRGSTPRIGRALERFFSDP